MGEVARTWGRCALALLEDGRREQGLRELDGGIDRQRAQRLEVLAAPQAFEGAPIADHDATLPCVVGAAGPSARAPRLHVDGGHSAPDRGATQGAVSARSSRPVLVTHADIPSRAFPQDGTYALRILRRHLDPATDQNGDFDHAGATLFGDHRLSIEIPRSNAAD